MGISYMIIVIILIIVIIYMFQNRDTSKSHNHSPLSELKLEMVKSQELHVEIKNQHRAIIP